MSECEVMILKNCRHSRESERNWSYLPVDLHNMTSASSIALASTEQIDGLIGRRFLHNQDATMAADPTASPILHQSVKMRV